MDPGTWHLIAFTLRMAAVSTLAILPAGLALAWALARLDWPGKALVETLASLPLVLPPVVTGLVLLKLFGRRGPIGGWMHEQFDLDVLFTWRAVVLALATMSLPLFLRTARAAIEAVDPAYEQLARTLGAGSWRVFWTVTLPLARRGVCAGVLLAFARSLGEFGATVMVAGNIEGQTTTLPVAIYQCAQTGDDAQSWRLAGVASVIAFAAVWAGDRLVRRPA